MNLSKILNGKQESARSIYSIILKHCDESAEEIQKIPRFAELAVELKSLYEQLSTALDAKQESRNTTVVTAQKNDLIALIIAKLDKIADVVLVIADDKDQVEWAQKAELCHKKHLAKLSEETLELTANNFTTFLKSMDTKLLQHYGVEADEITKLSELIPTFQNLRLKKGLAATQKSSDQKSVVQLFAQMEKVKGKMDSLISRFEEKKSPFFEVYKAAVASPPQMRRAAKAPKKPNVAAAKRKSKRGKKNAEIGNTATNGTLPPEKAQSGS